jgi:4-hydroxyphenylpyruvate dioxygenase-like putative hemolysin
MNTAVDANNESKPVYKKIDHIAIAVRDLDSAVEFFTNTLGFTLVRRLKIMGTHTGMVSAEIEHDQIKFVLCQGTEPQSQVSQLVANYGPGVAHIALEVDDVDSTVTNLRDQGVSFDTTVIEGPGLQQAFSSRCRNSGLSFEFIKRTSEAGFLESNVQQLFEQLERAGVY